MASPTRWTWVWASSGSWWWTGKPGMLQSMGSQRVRHDWATELNWMKSVQGLPWQQVCSPEQRLILKTSPWVLEHRKPHNLVSCSIIFVNRFSFAAKNWEFHGSGRNAVIVKREGEKIHLLEPPRSCWGGRGRLLNGCISFVRLAVRQEKF